MKIYLCIDLEATCFEGCTLEDMETIGIGAVAVLEDGTTVDTFQSYVRPQYTEVTDYCTSITNITPNTLCGAPAFDAMLRHLYDWLCSLPTWPHAWYSWGNYDLRQLELDAGPTRWNLQLPLPEHRNAKKLFRARQIKKGREVGLVKALDLMGLSFEGRHHSALDDGKNVARLFQKFHDPE